VQIAQTLHTLLYAICRQKSSKKGKISFFKASKKIY